MAKDALKNSAPTDTAEISFKFLTDSALKAVEKDTDGKKYVRLTASSDDQDFAGDVMSAQALRKMETAAVGTCMFMNHKTQVPEDLFGTVVETELLRKPVQKTDGSCGEALCLEYLVEVYEENERALKCWQMINKGTKLGASVTVIVTDSSPNPNRKKGRIFEDIEYLECSIVGMPCNRQSWTNSARKSLDEHIRQIEIQEKEVSNQIKDQTPEAAETEIEQIQDVTAEKSETAGAQTLVAETAAAEEVTVETAAPELMPRTKAAIAAFEAFKANPTGEPSQIFGKVEKGLFNEILNQEPSLWDLWDILCSVKWNLMSRKWNLDQVKATTGYDEILAEWALALAEFADAGMKSFAFWGEFPSAAAEAKAIENALAVEKSFDSFAALYENAGDEFKPTLKGIGEQIAQKAQSLGLIPAAQVAQADASEDAIRKSQIFIDMEQKATEADTAMKAAVTRAETAETNLNIAKTGLEIANALLAQKAKEPLAAVHA